MNYIKKFYKIDFDIYIVQSDCIDYIIQYTSIAVLIRDKLNGVLIAISIETSFGPAFQENLLFFEYHTLFEKKFRNK